MARSLTEKQQKQEKLRQVLASVVELKQRKKEFQRRQRNRHLLVSAIKGTFLAAFWFSKYGDQFSESNNDSSFDSEQTDIFADESLIDDLFHDFFDIFDGIEIEDVDVLVVSIDLAEITLFDLEATQAELDNICAVLPPC